jgi:hypothetical protein
MTKKPKFNKIYVGVWTYDDKRYVFVSLTKAGLCAKILPEILDRYEDVVGCRPDDGKSDEDNVVAYFMALMRQEKWGENLTIVTDYLGGCRSPENHPLYDVICETIVRIEDGGDDCPSDVQAMAKKLRAVAEALES